MTPDTVRTVLACVAAFIASAVAALLWGAGAVDLVLLAAIAWLIHNRTTLAAQNTEARADADQAREDAAEARADAVLARGKAEAIEAHLSGLEPVGSGRHSDGDTVTWRAV